MVPERVRRAAKAGGPPALITAGIGIGATGIVGQEIEQRTASAASGVAQAVGVDPQFGPLLWILGSILILVIALFVPGLFERHPQ